MVLSPRQVGITALLYVMCLVPTFALAQPMSHDEECFFGGCGRLGPSLNSSDDDDDGFVDLQYRHNGSPMRIAFGNREITIYYDQPRLELRKIGVTAETKLFEGTLLNQKITGKAYTFKAGCPAASYLVTGYIKGNNMVLQGPAPHWDPTSCAIVNYTDQSPHNRIVVARTR